MSNPDSTDKPTTLHGIVSGDLLVQSSIVSEILKFRSSEIKSGRMPNEIKITDDQCRRLKEWCDSTQTVFIAPDGSKRVEPGVRFSEGKIFGMRFNCPNGKDQR